MNKHNAPYIQDITFPAKNMVQAAENKFIEDVSLAVEARMLEAKMPAVSEHMNTFEVFMSLGWIALGLLVVCAYIGIPLAALGNAIERITLTDCLFALGMIVGIALVILDILKRTSKE